MQRESSPSRRVYLLLIVAALGVSTAVAAQAPAPTRSDKDGVFPAAQARRGGALFEEKCTNCHALRIWGQEWPGKSVFEVYDMIRNFMPEDNPGSLSPQQTRDVVAYILQANKIPAGKKELPAVDDELKDLRLELP